MGKDWLLEVVVKDKKPQHTGKGEWAPEEILSWHCPGNEGQGTPPACSPGDTSVNRGDRSPALAELICQWR